MRNYHLSYEYMRGVFHGYKAAMELRLTYGKSFVKQNARDLEAYLRKRKHTDFDRGYSHAYSVVAQKESFDARDIAPFHTTPRL